MARVVVLDASVLIALHDFNDAHHAWALEMFFDTVDFQLAMSSLTFAEVLVHPIRAGKLDQFKSSISRLGLELRGICDTAGEDLALLRAETGLRMPDVAVLQLALSQDGALATTDTLLARKARGKGLPVFTPQPKDLVG